MIFMPHLAGFRRPGDSGTGARFDSFRFPLMTDPRAIIRDADDGLIAALPTASRLIASQCAPVNLAAVQPTFCNPQGAHDDSAPPDP
jgi:hypothetical protein